MKPIIANSGFLEYNVFQDPNAEEVIKNDSAICWDIIKRKDRLPIDLLNNKYRTFWLGLYYPKYKDYLFLNENKESLLHAYMTYVKKEWMDETFTDFWYEHFDSTSPATGKTVLDVALENNNVPNKPFYEFIESCHINTDEFLIHYCPEALDMNVDDFIKAIKEYKSKKS